MVKIDILTNMHRLTENRPVLTWQYGAASYRIKVFSVVPFLGILDYDVQHLPRCHHKWLYREVTQISCDEIGIL